MIRGRAKPARVVIDASVAIKWVIPERGSEAAVALRDEVAVEGGEMAVPELFWAEVGSVLWRLTRSGERRIEAVAAMGLFDTLASGALVTVAARPVASRALEIACATGASVYDGTYVALAELRRAHLWTADRRLVAAMAGSPWEELVSGL